MKTKIIKKAETKEPKVETTEPKAEYWTISNPAEDYLVFRHISQTIGAKALGHTPEVSLTRTYGVSLKDGCIRYAGAPVTWLKCKEVVEFELFLKRL